VLSEFEIKKIIVLERDHLECIVDPVDRKCAGAFIAGLETVLNE
jgi:hypothetical protein